MALRPSTLYPLCVACVVAIGACGLDVVAPTDVSASNLDGGIGEDGWSNESSGDAANPIDGSSSSSSSSGSSSSSSSSGGSLPNVIPSHLTVLADPSAPDLTGVSNIDTANHVVTLASGAVAPAVRFENVDGKAVLFAGRWTVDVNLAVSGSLPLIVLAAREVTIAATLDASAKGARAGPGGSSGGQGGGRGLSGTPIVADDPGGGGAGFGTAGAAGGNGSSTSVLGGFGGVAYGALITDFVGGSGGGAGSPFNVTPCTNNEGGGGAGGGALQITSPYSITIATKGIVAASGGGGRGGCLNDSSTMSGGGGGSGGMIFLEAPTINVAGFIAANGGGGGGGGQSGTATAGQAGEDGRLSLTPAAGGVGSTDRYGGHGGVVNTLPQQPPGNFNNAGGGGGAVGRVWLRTRGAPATVPATASSPTPKLDTSL